MKQKPSIIKILLCLFIALLILPKTTYAYLDPGAGSYLLQIIAAGFFTALFLFKGWFNKVKEFFLKIILRKDKTPVDKTSEKDK